MQRLLLMFGLVALGVLASGGVAAQDAREGDLSVEVSVQGPARQDHPAKVLVSITNAGEVPVTLPARPDWDAVGGLEIEVASGAAPARRLDPPAHLPSRPTAEAGPSTLVLAPGQTLGIFRPLAPGELFAAKGTYRLTATYRRPGHSPVTSAPVEVVVE